MTARMITHTRILHVPSSHAKHFAQSEVGNIIKVPPNQHIELHLLTCCDWRRRTNRLSVKKLASSHSRLDMRISWKLEAHTTTRMQVLPLTRPSVSRSRNSPFAHFMFGALLAFWRRGNVTSRRVLPHTSNFRLSGLPANMSIDCVPPKSNTLCESEVYRMHIVASSNPVCNED